MSEIANPLATSHKPRHQKKRAFLAAYAQLGTITHASEAAGIDRSAHYRWMREDPNYPDAFAAAQEKSIERLERELERRAVEGVEKPVYQGGKKVGTVREYSDTLLIFRLKALRPEMYRDRYHVSAEVTHHNGDSELDRSIEQLLGQFDAEAPIGSDTSGTA